jgi:hypothetical protein
MDEAENLLERLSRIRELDRGRAPASELLGELRKLVGEAEAWARLEGDKRAGAAADEIAASVAGVDEVQATRPATVC